MNSPTVDALLNSTKPIVFDTKTPEWPYAYCGTCFPVRFRETLYIVSADHCYTNFAITPPQTLYMTPNDLHTAFAFDLQVRAESPMAKDKKHRDQVVLRVAKSKHPPSQTSQVSALDLSNPANSTLPTNRTVTDIVLRGYPFDAPKHEIDYDELKIRQQAYTTNGCLQAQRAIYDFCYLITLVTPIPAGMSPKGMSGSPIYGVNSKGNPLFCGMIIEYNYITKDYLAVGPEVLVNSLRQLAADESAKQTTPPDIVAAVTPSRTAAP